MRNQISENAITLAHKTRYIRNANLEVRTNFGPDNWAMGRFIGDSNCNIERYDM